MQLLQLWKESVKKFRLVQDSKPWSLQYQCSALANWALAFSNLLITWTNIIFIKLTIMHKCSVYDKLIANVRFSTGSQYKDNLLSIDWNISVEKCQNYRCLYDWVAYKHLWSLPILNGLFEVSFDPISFKLGTVSKILCTLSS